MDIQVEELDTTELLDAYKNIVMEIRIGKIAPNMSLRYVKLHNEIVKRMEGDSHSIR